MRGKAEGRRQKAEGRRKVKSSDGDGFSLLDGSHSDTDDYRFAFVFTSAFCLLPSAFSSVLLLPSAFCLVF
jgi:hypothetical protein